MKNAKIVEELKQLNPDDYVEITLQMGKKSLLEICYHNGIKFEKNFSCESETSWRSAELKTESMTVSDVIELLEEKEISELCESHFDGLTIEESVDGAVDVSNIEWETPLTEEEESDYTPHDLYWDSDIVDSEVQFNEGSIYSMKIKCGEYEVQIDE